MNKYYLVKLIIMIGEYEKSSNHVVEATSGEEAGAKAILDECHGEPDYEDENKQRCYDVDGMAYRVYGVKEINSKDYKEYRRITSGIFW